jgi:hypothetical protein
MVTLNRHIAIQLNLLVQQSSDSSQVFTDMVNHVAVQLREPWYARLFTSTLWFHGDSNMLGNVSIGQHAKHMNFFSSYALSSLPFSSQQRYPVCCLAKRFDKSYFSSIAISLADQASCSNNETLSVTSGLQKHGGDTCCSCHSARHCHAPRPLAQ